MIVVLRQMKQWPNTNKSQREEKAAVLSSQSKDNIKLWIDESVWNNQYTVMSAGSNDS